ncbi:MAG: integrase [Clostridia bacterium]|nr:integrase [Clostridia bacterium]
MVETSYFKQRNYKNDSKTKEILSLLPVFCDEFFIGIEGQTSSLTRLNYAQDLKIFFHFLTTEIIDFSDKTVKDLTLCDLSKLTSTHLEIFMNYLTGFYLNDKFFSNTATTKCRKISAIRSLLKYFYKKDKLSQNISAKINTPKIKEKEIIRLEVDEVVKLLDSADDPAKIFSKMQKAFNKVTRKRDLAIFSLLLGTGIRVSECVGLNIEDVDFKTNGFKITRKGGSQTVLYFSNEVADSLREYLEERKKNNKVSENEKALFLSLQNKRMCVRTMEKLVKKYSTACFPLKHITPHKLRSTFGTNLYRETGDIYIVADVLGHRDVNTTKKHYAAISDDSRRNVANVIKLRKD